MRSSIRWAIASFALVYNLHAGIEAYFKPASNKSNNHTMSGIDFIYMINLDERPEKFDRCAAELRPFDIHPYRFSAVNGWKLPLETITDVGVKFQKGMKKIMGTSYLPNTNLEPTHGKLGIIGQTYFCHCMSRGAIAIVLSHLSILQDAMDSGYQTIWVIEDDIVVKQNPHVLSKLINKLDRLVDKDWDILFTDQNTQNDRGEYVLCTAAAQRPNFFPKDPNNYKLQKKISSDFKQIGARFGAYSMIIRRSGIEKILNFIKAYKIFLPYDMDFYLPKGIKLFTVTHDVVSHQPHAPSDNGGPNYLNG